MKERYRLRHPSLHGTLGPYSVEELHRAIATASFPPDSRVLPVDAADEAANWRGVHEVLGLPAPPATVSLAQAAMAMQYEDARARRHAVRSRTAYPLLRTLILLLAVLGTVVNLALMMVPMSIATWLGHWPPQPFAVVAIAVIVVGAGLLLALLDIADCNLQRLARDD